MDEFDHLRHLSLEAILRECAMGEVTRAELVRLCFFLENWREWPEDAEGAEGGGDDAGQRGHSHSASVRSALSVLAEIVTASEPETPHATRAMAALGALSALAGPAAPAAVLPAPPSALGALMASAASAALATSRSTPRPLPTPPAQSPSESCENAAASTENTAASIETYPSSYHHGTSSENALSYETAPTSWEGTATSSRHHACAPRRRLPNLPGGGRRGSASTPPSPLASSPVMASPLASISRHAGYGYPDLRQMNMRYASSSHGHGSSLGGHGSSLGGHGSSPGSHGSSVGSSAHADLGPVARSIFAAEFATYRSTETTSQTTIVKVRGAAARANSQEATVEIWPGQDSNDHRLQ